MIIAIECEGLTSGSGAKRDYLGFGQIDSELPLLAEKLQGIDLPL